MLLLTMLLWQTIFITLHFTTNVDSKTFITKLPLPRNDRSENHNITFVKNKTKTFNENHTELKMLDQNSFTNATRNESKVESQLRQLKQELETLKNKVLRKSMNCELLPSNICGPCSCVDERRLPEQYYCDCRNIPAQKDCLEFRQNNYIIDGIYKVTQNSYKTIQVYCDQTTDNGGWTVFQRRFDGSESFHRDWEMYKVGFGDLQFEHWLGNEHLHTMMLHSLYYKGSELRVDLMDWDHDGVRKPKYAYYDQFEISNEFAKYELHVGGYNGTAGDAFTAHNKLDFTTIDRDHDIWAGGNCAHKYFGGWWYTGTNCVGGGATLNHHYYQVGMSVEGWHGIVWTGINSATQSLKRSEMKFRRRV